PGLPDRFYTTRCTDGGAMSPSPRDLVVRLLEPRTSGRSSGHELAAVRTWVTTARPVLERAERPVFEPLDGGALLHRLLRRLRGADEPRRGDPPREG